MNNSTIPIVSNPQLIDKAFAEIQIVLKSKLMWLTTAFGKAETRPLLEGNKKEVTPAIYAGGLDYVKLFPDEHLGNFSFFTANDGYNIEADRQSVEGQSEFSLIFWYNLQTIYPTTHEYINNRHVVKQVTDVLRSASLLSSSIKMMKVYEDGQNIYKGYSDKEIESQFLMRPYGGFRIEGIIHYQDNNFCPTEIDVQGIGVMQIGTIFIVS